MTPLEALRPFALYAEYMAGRWGQRDDSCYYGVKRVGAPQVQYGDFRKALVVYRQFKEKPMPEVKPVQIKSDDIGVFAVKVSVEQGNEFLLDPCVDLEDVNNAIDKAVSFALDHGKSYVLIEISR